MTEEKSEFLVDRFQDAVVDREHAQTAYRRSCQKEFEEAREALLAALSTKQEAEGEASRSQTAAPFDQATQAPAAWRDVLSERRRQVEMEGWHADHDDAEHDNGSLARAAACYALGWIPTIISFANGGQQKRSLWPWEQKWWKPKDRRRDLVRAGALILAEIERLDRAAKQEGVDERAEQDNAASSARCTPIPVAGADGGSAAGAAPFAGRQSLPAALQDALGEIEEFLQDQHDIRDGAGGQQLPNKAMSLSIALKEALGERP
jgi:hypothetical protein